MPLTWDVSKCDEDTCWRKAPEDIPAQGIKKGTQYLRGQAEAMIWLTMAVSMPEITERNWHEFYMRVNLYERLFGEYLLDEDHNPMFVPASLVQNMIGLKTNVSPETLRKWATRMCNNFKYEHERKMQREEKNELVSAD